MTRVPVCNSCWQNLPQQSGLLCATCGESLGVSDFGERSDKELLCRVCRLVPPAFERAFAHGLYRGTLRSLLHLLKYEGLEPLARRLGALMAAQLSGLADLPAKMLVVPVPLFRAKRRQRGFNQAELLADGLLEAMRRIRPDWEGDPAARVLARQRATESQAGLSLSRRQRNLRGAFFVPNAELMRGRDVLLIDDIYTTGATARACSQALKRAGAARVWVATVARAQRHEIELRGPKAVLDGARGKPGQEDYGEVALWDAGNTVQ